MGGRHAMQCWQWGGNGDAPYVKWDSNSMVAYFTTLILPFRCSDIDKPIHSDFSLTTGGLLTELNNNLRNIADVVGFTRSSA